MPIPITCIRATLTDLQAIIPMIPIQNPQLGKAIYEMILDHLLLNDKPVCPASYVIHQFRVYS